MSGRPPAAKHSFRPNHQHRYHRWQESCRSNAVSRDLCLEPDRGLDLHPAHSRRDRHRYVLTTDVFPAWAGRDVTDDRTDDCAGRTEHQCAVAPLAAVQEDLETPLALSTATSCGKHAEDETRGQINAPAAAPARDPTTPYPKVLGQRARGPRLT